MNRQMRVLVADDDPLTRNLVRAILREAGWAVDTCGDGWEALAGYDPRRHAALVLDNHMARCSGTDVLRILRSGGDDVPVVIMSGDCGGGLALARAELSRGRFLGKPFEGAELLDSLVSAMAVQPAGGAVQGGRP